VLHYVAWVRPFKKWEYNLYEMVNEATVFGLGVFQQMFLEANLPPPIKQVFGWIFVSVWVILTLSNLAFLIYSSFIQNYDLWLGVLHFRDKMKMHEKKVENEFQFKGKFIGDNPNNFMMAFESTNTKQYLEYRVFENHIFNDKFRKRKEIEWLERNGFNKKEIREIFPYYKPRKFKDMYLVNEELLEGPPPLLPPLGPEDAPAELAADEPA
jgi:hypothetical protein